MLERLAKSSCMVKYFIAYKNTILHNLFMMDVLATPSLCWIPINGFYTIWDARAKPNSGPVYVSVGPVLDTVIQPVLHITNCQS